MAFSLLSFIVTVGVAAGVAWLALRVRVLAQSQTDAPLRVLAELERQHRAMLKELSETLAVQSDRVHGALATASDRLRDTVSAELSRTRDRLQSLEGGQTESLAKTRESILEKVHQTLAAQGKAGQELLQTTLLQATQQIMTIVEQLTKTTDRRLVEISGKVTERLDEGFKKTNETFVSVMARLATIDEAQKKIDGLTTNVVSLQQLLGDKRSRGAFGEVQLEALVRNLLPPGAYAFQHTLSTGVRVDCALLLPAPSGTVAIDSKFPLENYGRMIAREISDTERAQAAKLFKADVRRHIDAIAEKYILPGETSDGAVMFLPAEAVFAEIHGYHPDLVEHAQKQRVWIVSPTTMMAVLNTARAVLKDVETRKQVHVIKESLGKLGKEFERFDERMRKLADHIRLAQKDADDVCITSRKISTRFSQIERVELEDEAELVAIEAQRSS